MGTSASGAVNVPVHDTLVVTYQASDVLPIPAPGAGTPLGIDIPACLAALAAVPAPQFEAAYITALEALECSRSTSSHARARSGTLSDDVLKRAVPHVDEESRSRQVCVSRCVY